MKIINFEFEKNVKDPYRPARPELYGYAKFLYKKYPWNNFIEMKAILKGLPAHEQYSTRTSNVPWAGDWYSAGSLELFPISFRKKLDRCLIEYNALQIENRIKSNLIDYINKINKV